VKIAVILILASNAPQGITSIKRKIV
jgi:hypothetical protein